jgi:hypothetical protein
MKKAVAVGLSFVFFSSTLFASFADKIKVTVVTKEKKAAAIGFQVDGKSHGGIGKKYRGSGPKNAMYSFGYKKNSIWGTDVSCGQLQLSHDVTISLYLQDGLCRALIV